MYCILEPSCHGCKLEKSNLYRSGRGPCIALTVGDHTRAIGPKDNSKISHFVLAFRSGVLKLHWTRRAMIYHQINFSFRHSRFAQSYFPIVYQ